MEGTEKPRRLSAEQEHVVTSLMAGLPIPVLSKMTSVGISQWLAEQGVVAAASTCGRLKAKLIEEHNAPKSSRKLPDLLWLTKYLQDHPASETATLTGVLAAVNEAAVAAGIPAFILADLRYVANNMGLEGPPWKEAATAPTVSTNLIERVEALEAAIAQDRRILAMGGASLAVECDAGQAVDMTTAITRMSERLRNLESRLKRGDTPESDAGQAVELARVQSLESSVADIHRRLDAAEESIIKVAMSDESARMSERIRKLEARLDRGDTPESTEATATTVVKDIDAAVAAAIKEIDFRLDKLKEFEKYSDIGTLREAAQKAINNAEAITKQMGDLVSQHTARMDSLQIQFRKMELAVKKLITEKEEPIQLAAAPSAPPAEDDEPF